MRITCWGSNTSTAFTEEDNKKARELLTKAIEINSTFARAYVGLAMVDSINIDNGWTSSQQESLDHWLSILRTALAKRR